MDLASLCSGHRPAAHELELIARFIGATNAGELASLAALFDEDAQVNDQLRNFWGRAEIGAWLEREIVGERIVLKALGIKKHYDVVMVSAEIRGDFETPPVLQPLIVDLYFTVKAPRILRLLILLARVGTQEPDIRRAS